MTDKQLWVCERKAHLPEHNGATGYFYYNPLYEYKQSPDKAALVEVREDLRRLSICRTSQELKEEFGDGYDPDHYDFETGFNDTTLKIRQTLAKLNDIIGRL